MRTAEQITRYAAKRKAYYDANRETLLAQARERRKLPAIKAKNALRMRVYLEQNREKINAADRLRYGLLNPPAPKAITSEPEPAKEVPRLTIWQEVRKWTRDEWRIEFGSRTTFRPRRGEQHS